MSRIEIPRVGLIVVILTVWYSAFGAFPTTASADSIYVVQPGDTLSAVASSFSTSLESLVEANDLSDPNLIFVGQRLIIPGPGDARVEPAAQEPRTAPAAGPGSILANRRLLTYYGNPYESRMGIMGALGPQELVTELESHAAVYEELSDLPVQPAIHFIVTVAQAGPGEDGMYRARMPVSLVEEYADLAAQNGMLLFLDIQFGRSTVQEELTPWIPLLTQPHVHLALDPEFDMWGAQLPGEHLGHMTSAEINYAQEVLTDIVEQNGLPSKVLILHQFTASMLPDKGGIRSYPSVEIVTDMDGFGGPALKLKHYQWYVAEELIEYAGIKLFFDQDVPLLTPDEIMSLSPVPDVIIYQ